MDPLDMLNEFINENLFPEGCPPIEWLNDEDLISLCSFPGEERDLDHVDRYASTYQFELDTLAKEAYLERDRRLQAEAAAGSFSPEEAAGSFSSEEAAGSFSSEEAAGSFSSEEAAGSFSSEEAVVSFSPEAEVVSFSPEAEVVSFSPEAAVVSFSPEAAVVSFSPEAEVVSFSSEEAVVSLSPEAAVVSFSSEEAVGSLSPEAAVVSFSSEEAVVSFSSEEAVVSFSPEAAVVSLSPEAAVVSFSPEEAVVSFSPEAAVVSFSPETVTESSHPNAFDGVTDMEIDVPVDPLPYKVSVESIVFMTSKLVLEKTDKRSLKESHNIFAKNAYCLYAEQLLRLIQNKPTPYFQFDEALHNRTSVDDVMDTTSTLRKCLAENNIELQSVRRVSKVKEEIAKDKHELLFMCRISTSFKHKKIRSPLTEVDTDEIHLVLLTDGILYSHFLVASDTLSFFTLRKNNLKTVTISLGELPECPEVEANILIQNIIRTFDVIR
jgi:uncharacterized protein YdhG (YjbR/CyaY superfamily)